MIKMIFLRDIKISQVCSNVWLVVYCVCYRTLSIMECDDTCTLYCSLGVCVGADGCFLQGCCIREWWTALPVSICSLHVCQPLRLWTVEVRQTPTDIHTWVACKTISAHLFCFSLLLFLSENHLKADEGEEVVLDCFLPWHALVIGQTEYHYSWHPDGKNVHAHTFKCICRFQIILKPFWIMLQTSEGNNNLKEYA